MQITSPLASANTQDVVIDCTVLQDAAAAEAELLAWISSSPARGTVHVILPSVRSASTGFQRQLQVLGCRVTRKVSH